MHPENDLATALAWKTSHLQRDEGREARVVPSDMHQEQGGTTPKRNS
jgi:hypothetical protein